MHLAVILKSWFMTDRPELLFIAFLRLAKRSSSCKHARETKNSARIKAAPQIALWKGACCGAVLFSGYLSDARGDHNEYQQGSQKAQRELDKEVGRSTVLSHKIDLYVGRIPSFPAGKQCNREAAQRHHDVRAEPVEEVEDDAVENLDLTPYAEGKCRDATQKCQAYVAQNRSGDALHVPFVLQISDTDFQKRNGTRQRTR